MTYPKPEFVPLDHPMRKRFWDKDGEPVEAFKIAWDLLESHRVSNSGSGPYLPTQVFATAYHKACDDADVAGWPTAQLGQIIRMKFPRARKVKRKQGWGYAPITGPLAIHQAQEMADKHFPPPVSPTVEPPEPTPAPEPTPQPEPELPPEYQEAEQFLIDNGYGPGDPEWDTHMAAVNAWKRRQKGQ